MTHPALLYMTSHQFKLEAAKAFLASRAKDHPEWVVKRRDYSKDDFEGFIMGLE